VDQLVNDRKPQLLMNRVGNGTIPAVNKFNFGIQRIIQIKDYCLDHDAIWSNDKKTDSSNLIIVSPSFKRGRSPDNGCPKPIVIVHSAKGAPAAIDSGQPPPNLGLISITW